jgi:hypothetical protein
MWVLGISAVAYIRAFKYGRIHREFTFRCAGLVIQCNNEPWNEEERAEWEKGFLTEFGISGNASLSAKNLSKCFKGRTSEMAIVIMTTFGIFTL